MANLLPEKNKSNVRTEFFVRAFVILLVIVFLGLCLASSLKVASYVLIDLKKGEVDQQIEVFDKILAFRENTHSVNILRKENAKLLVLQEDIPQNFTNILEKIIEKKPKDIQIGMIYYEIEKSKGERITKLSVNGISKKRSDLIDFVELIEDNELFSQVSFPVSDLAKGEGIEFSLKIIVNK